VRLLTTTRPAAPRAPEPVSVDAVVAKIGGTADELVAHYGTAGDDWMGRPTIRFEDAQQAVAAWEQRQSVDALLPVRFEAYREDRARRLYALQQTATAQARAAFVGPHRGGEEQQRYLQVQWDAERRVVADFEANEPEMTITEFRAWEEKNR
jgi:hypothetical protein